VQGGQGAAGAGVVGQAAGGGPGILAGQMGYGGSVASIPLFRNLSFCVLVLHLSQFLSLSHLRTRALSVHSSKEGGGKEPLKLSDTCSGACFPPSFLSAEHTREICWIKSGRLAAQILCIFGVSLVFRCGLARANRTRLTGGSGPGLFHPRPDNSMIFMPHGHRQV